MISCNPLQRSCLSSRRRPTLSAPNPGGASAARLLFHEKPELLSVFIIRNLSKKEKEKQKKAFNFGAVKVALRGRNTDLTDVFIKQYERSIDFGALPNPHAGFSAMVPIDEGR
jgi:hypothetical protein